MIKKVFNVALYIVFGIAFILVLAVCYITPEKTKKGEYTNIVKYWTDDEYICNNFDCSVKGK